MKRRLVVETGEALWAAGGRLGVPWVGAAGNSGEAVGNPDEKEVVTASNPLQGRRVTRDDGKAEHCFATATIFSMFLLALGALTVSFVLFGSQLNLFQKVMVGASGGSVVLFTGIACIVNERIYRANEGRRQQFNSDGMAEVV